MASNFLEQWKSSGRKINHSAFDISSSIAATSPLGLIQPLRFFETNPNENFQLDVKGLLRSMTLNTAAFADMKLYIDATFVPYSQIWHNFNSFVSQKDDRHSSAYRDMLALPQINLDELYRLIIHQYVSAFILKYIPTYQGTMRLRGKNGSYETAQISKDYLVKDIHDYPVAYTLLRSIQFFKLGNLNFVPQKIESYAFENGVELDQDGHVTRDTREQFIENIMDMVDEVDEVLFGVGHTSDRYVNIMRPAAYQHIFYDKYRNSYFDEYPIIQPDDSTHPAKLRYVEIYNFDDIKCTTDSECRITFDWFPYEIDSGDLDYTKARIINLFMLHYHQYEKDIYTSGMNSTQFGAVSGVSFDDFVLHTNSDQDLILANQYTGYSNDVVGAPSFAVDVNNMILYAEDVNSVVPIKFKNPTFLDVLALRRAELMQQWKMNALRAGNMVDDNFKQHYGVEPYYESDNNVLSLGSWSASLNINPVTATASTDSTVNGTVGDLAAIGIGSVNGSVVRFKCNDFGVIVFNVFLMPRVMYSANGIDENNTLTEPFDFYSEEFENVGFEPLQWLRQNAMISGIENANMCFVPPYTRYKTNVDECFGEFSQLEYGNVVKNQQGAITAVSTKESYGTMLPWVIQRADVRSALVNGVVTRGLESFYIDPACINPLFAVEYDGTQKTDPFSLYLQFDVKALRPMSVLGLPIFG